MKDVLVAAVYCCILILVFVTAYLMKYEMWHSAERIGTHLDVMEEIMQMQSENNTQMLELIKKLKHENDSLKQIINSNIQDYGK